MARVLVFAGSLRNGSLNRQLAAEAASAFAQAGLEVTLADLRDYPMPLYDGDLEAAGGLPAQAKAFKELVRAHDALVIASPEYNGSFPALLKNAIDWATRPEPGESPLAVFRGKPATLLSASPGAGGGARGLRHLRELLEMIGVRVLPEQLAVPRASQSFDGAGRLRRNEDRDALHRLASRLGPALSLAGPQAA
jgi:chromate reductase, NAD(P)H dehydrogenase (quinone)